MVYLSAVLNTDELFKVHMLSASGGLFAYSMRGHRFAFKSPTPTLSEATLHLIF